MADKRKEAERFSLALAAQVRAEIAARDESVASVARITGINRETLDRWVKGERAFNIPNTYRVAIALGMDPHLLVLRAEERFASEATTNVIGFPSLSVVPDSVAAYKADGTHEQADLGDD